MDRQYTIDIKFITLPTVIHANCNAITFINNSTSLTDVAYINNVPIQPNQSLSIEGNENEVDKTVYNISFGTSTTATLIVLQKVNK